MPRKYMLLWLLSAAATTGCTTMEAQIKSSGAMGQPDADYIATASDLVQLDDAAGKLAATKASDPRLQDLSSQIMAQADTLSPGLQAALRVEGRTQPSGPSQQVAQQIDKLRGLSGPAFDREYVADELAAHQRAVAVFQQEDTATKDGAMRTQVETELPAVQDNFAKLQVLSGEFGRRNG